jgi:hypothetical protein
MLLGGWCELAAMRTDLERVARWKGRGEAQWDAHRRRQAPRQRPASAVEGGRADAETEDTQT